jgi:branched-chain amino acid aminotransferase
MIFWKNNEFLSEEIPEGFNFSLHYGPVIWLGVKSYEIGNGQYHILFLDKHIDRLYNSAKALNIKIPYDKEIVKNGIIQLVEKYEDKNIYLRPCVYIDRMAEGVSRVNNENFSIAIFPTPTNKLPIPKNGIKMHISSYNRGYPQFQMQIKNSTNYLIGQMAKEDTIRQGFDDALFQDNRGYITEAIVANFFIIKDNIIYTPPSDGSILEGITRNWIIKEFNVKEKYLTRYDLYTADAAFISGTFVQSNWVRQIDHVELYKHELYEDLVNRYNRFIYKLDV